MDVFNSCATVDQCRVTMEWAIRVLSREGIDVEQNDIAMWDHAIRMHEAAKSAYPSKTDRGLKKAMVRLQSGSDHSQG